MVKVVRLLSLKCLPSSKSHEKSLRMSAGSKRIGLGILVWGILVSPLGSALASSAACVNCHQDQVSAWSDSDHAWAMRPPEAAFIKAPFQGESVAFDGLEGLFDQSDRALADVALTQLTVLGSSNGVGPTQFYIHLRDTKAGAIDFQRFTVRYTFGHEPLQQYLIALGEDRLQVAPFAYDTRPETAGGQRWIHLESFAGPDRMARFDWRQPLQNWNGMCADCHSRGFRRGYDPATQLFNSSFDAINVDCLACHNPSDGHDALDGPPKAGQWVRPPEARIAHWQGTPRDPAAMDTCFACHSLRTPLTDGFHPEAAFLDQFRPESVIPPFYQADGQIEEEVYVYGSFLQSKMYQAGVQCQDCHDPHTAEVKVQGNGLCLTCHQPKAYETPQHHGHALGSQAAQCVTCHMPGKTYMGVDFRRDHRFGVPNAPISHALDTRDVCQSCHEDRWAAFLAVTGQNLGLDDAEQFVAETRQAPALIEMASTASSEQVLAMLADESLPAITKAAQLKTLPQSAQRFPEPWLVAAMTHAEPLVRLSAVEVASVANVEVSAEVKKGLLRDPVLAVRLAAQYLRGRGDQTVLLNETANATALDAMQAAADISLRQIAWRGEGRLQRAQRQMRQGDWSGAVAELQAAVAQDPYFVGGYLNLADVRRQQGRENQALSILAHGLERLPNEAMLHYSTGLTHIRLRAYAAAQPSLAQASVLAPARIDFFYAYLVLMDALGKRVEALGRIKARYPTGAPPQIDQLQKHWLREP
jgi:predicted CXXCH cytochrome family protein